ncbi:MAG: hypothetical protein NT175_03075 [Bacteroidetes bacterium]|nr:hypothetical protein [Bacteroidota bacterium]
MKKLIIICCILLLTLIACKKDNHLMYEGKITGFDASKCMCCGGWFIEINNTTFRFYNLPENSNLDLWNEPLPIYVEVVWKKDEKGCLGDEIIIEYINIDFHGKQPPVFYE